MPAYIYRGQTPCRVGTRKVQSGDRVELPGAPNELFELVPVEPERPALAPVVHRPRRTTSAETAVPETAE